MRLSIHSLATLLAVGPTLAAQDIFIASSGEPQLTRARDLDNNGSANDFAEFTKCAYAPSLLKQGYEVRSTSLFGAPGLLWLDNDPTTRSLVRLVDVNGNGVFEPSEVAMVANLSTLFGINDNSSCFFGSCVEGQGGRVYVSNNMVAATPFPTAGIYGVNGIAASTPTAASALLQTDVVPIFENFLGVNSGVTTKGGSFERIGWIAATNTLFAYHSLDDCIYALRDMDNDGAFRTAGEFVNWFNAADHKPGIVKHPDFFGGPLSSYGALFNSIQPGPNNFGNRFTFHYIAFDPTTGAVYIGSRRGNQNGAAAGKVFKCVDVNGNGTCNDAGEVTVYVDDATPGTFIVPSTGAHYPPNAASGSNNYGFQGLAVNSATGEVYALSSVGPVSPTGPGTLDMVWKFVDANADGDANDPGEQLPVFFQAPSGSVSRSLEIVNTGTFGAPFAAASMHGPGGFQSPGTGGGCQLPTSTGVRFYKGAPYSGNSDFQVSVSGLSVGATFGQLWISQADWDPLLVKSFWDLLNGPPYFVGLPYPVDPLTRNLDEWIPIGLWTAPSPMHLDILDLAGTGTSYFENAPGGVITGAGGMAGAPAYADPLNGVCFGSPYLGRFDANIAIPASPSLVGQAFRLQWHVDDPLTSAPGAFRTVSDLGYVRIE